MTVNIIAGADIGNGYTKAVLKDVTSERTDEVDMPSLVRIVTHDKQNPTPDSEVATVFNSDVSFYNRLDARFETPLVSDQHRRLFGTSALDSKGAIEEFDTVSGASKAQQQLSKVLVLGTIAAKALKDYVSAEGILPTDELDVSATVALALPVHEYLRHRGTYADELLAHEQAHTVIIENFETKVRVNITFAEVIVNAEGASAQSAIAAHGESLIQYMLDEARTHNDAHATALVGIEASDIAEAKGAIGIDIGDGTTGFIATQGTDAVFNDNASRSFDRGYGSVLQDALDAMTSAGEGTAFSSRKHLAEYLLATPNRLDKQRHAHVKGYVDTEVKLFVSEVAKHLAESLRTASSAQVLYVYGGGSGAIREHLYPVLQETISRTKPGSFVPVMYLDAGFSRNLNREGLFIAAKDAAAK
ncbi:plasmid segregation protein ParM [Leucobacter exalbidus]|uniref:Plasmid segregation protein ParM n=1 Tax=Leucobacter exalbidus TaxID=662960 RepID=A0A940PVQ6_9MICO|nr:hypothetical protein [Leucobacter exalbidus]MBP1325076.1 plasmid segregation protein ParM [Leucobacter exalbidus]